MLARASHFCAAPRTTSRVARNAPAAPAPGARRLRTAFMSEKVELYSNGVFDFKQSPIIKKGEALPLGDGDDLTLLRLNPETNEPEAVKLHDVVAGKRVVVFGLPGAYTSVCSSKHVPQYNERADELKAQGVERIVCLSVNDPYVMSQWAQSLNVDPARVMLLADGEGLVHSRLGLLQHIPGLGIRSLRYSMLVDDGKVVVLNIEEPGGMSYKVSGPGHMLEDLAAIKKATQQPGSA